jgi:hypothetical protein
MAIDDDLPEYVGADKSIPAVPKAAPGKSWSVTDTPTAYAPPEIAGLEDDEPPRVTPYTPPAPGSSHPKHAILGPALRLDKAEHELTKAKLELTSAARALRDAELAEAEAERVFMAEMPGKTQDEALREYAAAELKARADRVAAGLSPDARTAIVHGSSVLDRNAAHRPRPAPGKIASPLQSNAVRRTV